MTAPTRTTPARTSDGGRLLRLALRIDAAASGALGLAGLLAAPRCTELLGPPAPLLLGVGAFLVVFALSLLVLAARPVIPSPAARVVVIGNGAWVVASVAAAVAGWGALTALGVGVVLTQALAVAAVADLQWLGLQRATVA